MTGILLWRAIFLGIFFSFFLGFFSRFLVEGRCEEGRKEGITTTTTNNTNQPQQQQPQPTTTTNNNNNNQPQQQQQQQQQPQPQPQPTTTTTTTTNNNNNHNHNHNHQPPTTTTTTTNQHQPTNQATNQPTKQPTNQPLNQPTNQLTNQPTNHPSIHPTTTTTTPCKSESLAAKRCKYQSKPSNPKKREKHPKKKREKNPQKNCSPIAFQGELLEAACIFFPVAILARCKPGTCRLRLWGPGHWLSWKQQQQQQEQRQKLYCTHLYTTLWNLRWGGQGPESKFLLGAAIQHFEQPFRMWRLCPSLTVCEQHGMSWTGQRCNHNEHCFHQRVKSDSREDVSYCLSIHGNQKTQY